MTSLHPTTHRGGIARFQLVLFAFGLLLLSAGCHRNHPRGLETVFAAAGENRTELEKALHHYERGGDPQKLRAMQFLLRNMDDHGYAEMALYDENGNEVAFDALDHRNLEEAQRELDALEERHGELSFKHKRVDKDVETITADYLIDNVELAFRAWRRRPWARELPFEVFRDHVLPYRGSGEALSCWRKACYERYNDLPDRMSDPSDLHEAANLIRKDVHQWVRFSPLYYLHPTDQSFDEMTQSGLGRCEDISNMMLYAMRANAIPAAVDYTPYWADRDNNHAWEVVLGEDGRASATLSNRAAKVYRKTFAVQRDSLGFIKGEDEKAPRWLSKQSYVDVTDQYQPTSDVCIDVGDPAPDKRFAYICVFNGGDWHAIHWSAVDGEEAVFTKMGRNILYLPAWFGDEKIEAAGPPFVVTKEGATRPLEPSPDRTIAIEIAATRPDTPDADTRRTIPRLEVEAGKEYELFVWRNGDWSSLGKQKASDEPVRFDAVPAGGLYWLVAEGSRRLERPFTVEDGRQVWW